MSSQSGTIRLCLTNLLHDHAWWFTDQILETPNVELAGVAESRDDLIDRMRKKLPQSSKTVFYKEPGRMLDECRPDALILLAPNTMHRDLFLEAARRGIHCMTDQPMTVSMQDALIMKEAAEKNKVQFMVNCYPLWEAGNAELFKRVKNGEIGEMYDLTTTRGMKGPKAGLGILTPQYVEWMYDPVRHGDGVLLDQAIYGIIYSILLIGKPLTVSARRVPVVQHPEGWIDDSCYLILGYEKATANVSASWAFPHPRGEIACYGSRGSLITRFGEPPSWESPLMWRNSPETVRTAAEQHKVELSEVPPERKHGIAYFTHCLRNGRPVEYFQSLDLHMAVMAVVEAARSSIKESRVVEIKY